MSFFCVEFCVDGTISVAALHGPFASEAEAHQFGVANYLSQDAERTGEEQEEDVEDTLSGDEWGRMTDQDSGDPIFQVIESQTPGT